PLVLPAQGLDGRLYRRLRFRRGGDLVADTRMHAARHSPVAMRSSIVVPVFIDARVGPRGSLEHLSQAEIEKLLDSGQGGLYDLFRKCALAVLNSGAGTDDAREIFDRYRDFDIRIVRHTWGIKLEVHNAPSSAFVDGQMIRGIKEHLFAVLRDVVFIANEIIAGGRYDLGKSADITNAVFHVLRNSRLLDHKARPNLVVCWGGHSIGSDEYKYSKRVGYELGLRGLDVCTGCGPGAMKGPMKGATIGHAKQRIDHGRRAAESDRQPARHHAGHRKAPRSLRAPRSRHRGLPRRRRNRRGDPLSSRDPARPGESGSAAAGR